MSEFVYQTERGTVSFRIARSLPLVLCALFASLTILLMFSLALGSFELSLPKVWQTLLAPQAGEAATAVLWDLRLPRYVAAVLVGAMLGLSGALLQGVTRNPLADPSLVGVSQGAGLCVVALIVLWPAAPLWLRPISAFAGAITAAALVQYISRGRAGPASLRFIFIGIGVSAIIGTATSAMLTYGQINQAAAALAWLAGSVHTATWNECAVLTAVFFPFLVPALVWAARPLSALRFGPEIATGLGLNLTRDRSLMISLAVALSALAVSMAGPLGFIGLIAPHLANRLLNARTGSHLLLSGLSGGCLVAMADLVGRTVLAPVQFPAGLVCAVVGAPLFLALILRRTATRTL